MLNWKIVAIIEFIAIIGLVSFMISQQEKKLPMDNNDTGFLSPRIYQGVLEPQSRLLFNFDPLEEALRDYINKKNKTISLYVLNVRDSSIMAINRKVE